jgi:DNA-binding transcriptional ArsR family regulator
VPEDVTLLAEPTRLRILRLVWERERSAGEIAAEFRTTFGAVSQHLRRLRDAGLISRRRDWKRLYYRADRERLAPLVSILEQLWAAQLRALADAEAEEQRTARRSARKPAGRTRHARPRRRR